MQHEGYALWRLRDTPGQSTLTAFPLQPVSRSGAVADFSGKAHHRPAVTTPDKVKALPSAKDRSGFSNAEPSLEAGDPELLKDANCMPEEGLAEATGAPNQEGLEVTRKLSWRHSDQSPSSWPAERSQTGGPSSSEAPVPTEMPEQRLGSVVGAQGPAIQNFTTVPASHMRPETSIHKGGLHEGALPDRTLERVPEAGNEGWQSSLESTHPLPQLVQPNSAVAHQQRQAHEGSDADQQTRIEHMLPGKFSLRVFLHTMLCLIKTS